MCSSMCLSLLLLLLLLLWLWLLLLLLMLLFLGHWVLCCDSHNKLHGFLSWLYAMTVTHVIRGAARLLRGVHHPAQGRDDRGHRGGPYLGAPHLHCGGTSLVARQFVVHGRGHPQNSKNKQKV